MRLPIAADPLPARAAMEERRPFGVWDANNRCNCNAHLSSLREDAENKEVS